MDQIDISLVILNYKSLGLVKLMLKQLFSVQTHYRIETIVVDNASGDNIGEWITKAYPEITFIQVDSNTGYASGNNVGIKQARGNYILIVNPDIVITMRDVEALYAYMESHPKVGIAGPRLTNADGSLQYSCAHFPTLSYPFARRSILEKTKWGKKWNHSFFMKDWDHADSRPVDWLQGACIIVRSEAMEKVGLLDERFKLYLEDTDWCLRFWESGYEVHYVASVSVIHLHGKSSAGSIFSLLLKPSSRWHLESFFKYLLKHKGKKNPRESLQ